MAAYVGREGGRFIERLTSSVTWSTVRVRSFIR
jgi:hypothetical protein